MENLFTIKKVAELTGLTVHAIRAWEKRYNVVVPERTDTNRRLYSFEDVEKLKLLHLASQEGFSIGSIHYLEIDKIKELLGKDDSISAQIIKDEPKSEENFAEIYFLKCLQAIKNLDAFTLEEELNRALVKFTQPMLIKKIITPLLNKIGDLWKSGEIRIVNEHVSTGVFRKFLSRLIDNNRVGENAPTLLVATPKGQLHELGALIISVIASADGWNVVYMGPDLPGEEIVAAVEKLNPRVLALSIVYPVDDYTLEREMVKIRQLLSNDTKIFAGGRSVFAYEKTLNEMNAKIIIDVEQFREELNKVRMI